MSYNCQNCGLYQEGKPVRVIVEKRKKIYPARTYMLKKAVVNGRRQRNVLVSDPGGKGWEVVREENHCKNCVPHIRAVESILPPLPTHIPGTIERREITKEELEAMYSPQKRLDKQREKW